jgi:uncharacterized protein
VSRALLDSNVLLALLDSDHVEHERARRWLEQEIGSGWASCAITENGFVRIISQPRYPSPVPAAQAIARLARATGTPSHEFWPCSVSLLSEQVVERGRLLGPRQVTDAYLLALAVAHGGRFATFNQSVPLAAIPGARREHLSIL